MRILFFTAPEGNFGDDLNKWLWEKVFDPRVWEVPDACVVGIGTILNSERINAQTVPERRVYALGSGAGYGMPIDTELHGRIEYLAVRGPLTADLLGLPADVAATDGAALLHTLKPVRRSPPGAGYDLFIPHLSSALSGQWKAVAAAAGMEYFDPRSSVDDAIERIGNARQVFTEAMHGAIFADTLRVPWVPLVTSPRILDFKWLDWTRSLGLPYRPIALPAPVAVQAKSQLVRRLKALAKGQSGAASTTFQENGEIVASYRAVVAREQIPSRPRKAAEPSAFWSRLDPWFTERSARALDRLRSAPAYLSEEAALGDRVGRLQLAIARLERGLLG